ncbi:DNA internalization-related competence protein ComEC/Rec2 [Alteromonas sp. ASW11-19]|uniref:DNA internalization-related competence protein ComEC/Rec2 n=1 Tax=Alteromonas salexigens TaxID=2982530 RepID=A0ABT2VMI8_9ALTE|nr:DNA internalization-related competence protein ComEC/Rec2 [Alteromonas salexigens]MCU7554289.1 DNA internalization-related competence protein ComEC/Rec2 [Alteromonas salexigens]
MRHSVTLHLSGFCLGAASSLLWHALPGVTTLIYLSGTYLVVCSPSLIRLPFLPRRCGKSSSALAPFGIGALAAGTLLGVIWMASVGHWYTLWQLPAGKIHEDIAVTGWIKRAHCDETRQRVYLAATHVGQTRLVRQPILLLSQRMPSQCLQVGQRVNMVARLKPVHGLANPGGFDYHRHLVSQGVAARGYIREMTILSPSAGIGNLRQPLTNHLLQHAQSDPRWLRALLLGDRSALTPGDWQMLQETGTAHLFSVSGMHVGVVAVSTVVALRLLLLLALRLRGYRAPVYNSRAFLTCWVLMLCAGYVGVTGAALPAVRAWVLLALFMVLRSACHHWSARQVAVVMVSSCIVLFPLQLLAAGMQLSVGAVLAIWLLIWRYRLQSRPAWQSELIMQAGLTLLLLPLTVMWFGVLSLSTLPVNLIVVPLVMLILPVLLVLFIISFLLPACAGWCVNAGITLLHGLIRLLETLHQSLDWVWYMPLSGMLSGLLILIFVLAIMPLFPFKRLTLSLLTIPLVLSGLPNHAEAWYLHVFDVGQGSAMAITRGSRAIVVDTGPAFEGRAMAMEQQVLPALQQAGIRNIDGVIVSHSDTDHAGGLTHLENSPLVHPDTFWHSPVNGCVADRTLHWQGLDLTYLWPDTGNSNNDNAHSCVVTVSGVSHRVLLPGDIERSTEYRLLTRNADVSADIMVAPHHGSKTSSTGAWITKVAAKHVVFTTGWLNRWGFPAADVVSRYQQHGTGLYSTAASGYLRFKLQPYVPVNVTTFRDDMAPRWYRKRRLAEIPPNVEELSEQQ